jgi:hypothetical protein
MKKLVNIMVLVFVLTVLSTVILNASGTGQLANEQANYLDDDPNEPEMQGAVVWAGSTCLSDDPNEPEFAGALARAFFSGLSDDPNEPGPEAAPAN